MALLPCITLFESSDVLAFPITVHMSPTKSLGQVSTVSFSVIALIIRAILIQTLVVSIGLVIFYLTKIISLLKHYRYNPTPTLNHLSLSHYLPSFLRKAHRHPHLTLAHQNQHHLLHLFHRQRSSIVSILSSSKYRDLDPFTIADCSCRLTCSKSGRMSSPDSSHDYSILRWHSPTQNLHRWHHQISTPSGTTHLGRYSRAHLLLSSISKTRMACSHDRRDQCPVEKQYLDPRAFLPYTEYSGLQMGILGEAKVWWLGGALQGTSSCQGIPPTARYRLRSNFQSHN